MKVAVISDIHGDLDLLREVLNKCELFVSVGDLTNFGENLDKILDEIESRVEEYILVPGNMERIEDYEELGAKNVLHGKDISIGGLRFFGIGGSNPTPFNTPFEITEEEIGDLLNKIEDPGKTILLTHFPPYGTGLDIIRDGNHVGSKSLREFLERNKILISFCGHIHECGGRVFILRENICVNVARKPFYFEW